MKEHVFRYGADQCIAQGLITRFRQVNFGALGLQTYNLFFNLSKTRASEAITFLSLDSRVVFLAENVDDLRYEATFVARNPTELLKLCTSLSSHTGISVVKPLWSIELEFHFFGDRFLAPALPLRKHLVRLTGAISPVDTLDLRILDALGRASNENAGTLARHLGKPISTLDYRIKKLVAAGVLSPELLSVNVPQTNLVECQILVSFLTLKPDLTQQMIEFCEKHAAVFKLILGFGGWNYKVMAKADSLSDLVALREAFEETFESSLAETRFVTRRQVVRHAVSLAHHPELAA